MANHKDLPSNEWHPAYPPGADLAVSGDVFLSDGLGSGSWESLGGLVDSGKAYAQLSSTNETLAIPQATDSTLNSDVDYINLTSLSMWSQDGTKDITVSNTDGTFTLTKAGTYMLSFWVDHSVDGATDANIAFRFSLNGVLDTKKLISTSDFAGDIRNSSANGIVFNASVGDIFRVHVACTQSRTLTVHSSQLNIVRL